MEKVYFYTGGMKPSEEQRKLIKENGGVWDRENQVWVIDSDKADCLPQMETGKTFVSLEDLHKSNALASPNSNSATQKDKEEYSPELKEAFNFKNGQSDELSPQALSAYVFYQAKFWATKYRGDKFQLEKQIRRDPLLNRSLFNTKAKEFEPKISRITQTLVVACQDAHALIPSFYAKLAKTDDATQRHFIKRDINKQLAKLEDKLSTFFPEHKKEMGSNKPSQGSIDADRFIQGQTSDLTLGALKSHVMKLTGALCKQALDDNINNQLATDRILNADLSKTSLKDLNISLPELIKHVADTVHKTREEISILQSKVDLGEITEGEKVKQAAALTYKARLSSVSTLPNTKVLEAQDQLGNEQNQEERFYIPLTKEQINERAVVKKIPNYRYSSQENVWSVPKSAAMMNSDLMGLKIYASHQDFLDGKEMDEQQKSSMFVKPENTMQKDQQNQQAQVEDQEQIWKL